MDAARYKAKNHRFGEFQMPTPQTAICAASHAHGYFLFLDRHAGVSSDAACAAIADACAALADWQAAQADARAVFALAIGSQAWSWLSADAKPALLTDFPHFAHGVQPMPHTPHDLLLMVRSERHDLNYLAASRAISALADAFEVSETCHGFRYLDSRDLGGFVDGTENPSMDERPAVALVAEEDAAFAGGSYLHVQRFVHKLKKWQGLPVAEQEAVIGRTKADDVELDDDARPATAHISRTVIEEDGEELAILRQSMPYGIPGGESGLLFISLCKTPAIFTRMLERMVVPDDGVYDHLLNYTQAKTGGAYFAPSLEWLQRLR